MDQLPSGSRIEIHATAFDPWSELDRWCGDAAACAQFVGRVRAKAMDGVPLQALELEHYPDFCEQRITAICNCSVTIKQAACWCFTVWVDWLRASRLVAVEPIVGCRPTLLCGFAGGAETQSTVLEAGMVR